jgi:hypothetical protein
LTIRLIDCRVSALSSTASQRSIGRKIGPLNIGPLQPLAQRLDRTANQKHPALFVRVVRLSPDELDGKAWRSRRFRIMRIEPRRRLIPHLLDPQPRHLAAPAAA